MQNVQVGPSGSTWAVPERYEIRKTIGRGAYGSVCEAYDKDKDVVVAIKQMKHLFGNLTDCKRILRELAILTRLRHDNVVKVHDIIVPADMSTFNEFCIVLEKCDMDLKKYIKMDVTLELWQINILLLNLLTGLGYVHACGIIHRDLKPANCLFNSADGSVKICDFGLARHVHGDPHLLPLPNTPRNENDELEEASGGVPHTKNKKRAMTKHVVTRWYRAPELALTPGEYTDSIDMWSVGCIYGELLQMLDGGEEFMDRSPLFPGSSCFPLSPAARGRSSAGRSRTRGQHDQLEVIFDVLGTPTAEDVAQLESDDARRYAEEFLERRGHGFTLKEYADAEAVELLTQMLLLNPRKRLDVPRALGHKMMVDAKAQQASDDEKHGVVSGSTKAAPAQVELSFEKEEDLNEKLLRKYYDEEIKRFHRLAAGGI